MGDTECRWCGSTNNVQLGDCEECWYGMRLEPDEWQARMRARTLTDQLERIERMASPGPWEHGTCPTFLSSRPAEAQVAECENEQDAQAIASLRNALPRIIAELRRLRETEREAVQIISKLLGMHAPAPEDIDPEVVAEIQRRLDAVRREHG